MGGKGKAGKSRLDRYYYMAKDHGYRARSAFKLIQMNQTYDILSGAHVVVDLCAAPGGWLQVAAKAVGQPSLVVGVDLDPIKPIYGVSTVVGDITEEECANKIMDLVDGREADVVLHDGAPNVGASWERDAYAQNELVCHAMKLACALLKKGGTFVTKVFRSKDYNSILWVTNQLFAECLVTKPRSSRAESAEIFVVCRGYKKPKKLDMKFFDPNFVFEELKEDRSSREVCLSEVLKGEIGTLDYPSVIVDCMEDMIDQETRCLLRDLQVVGDTDMKRLKRTLKKVQKAYQSMTEVEEKKEEEKEVDLRTNLEKSREEVEQVRRDVEQRERKMAKKSLLKRSKRLGLLEADVEEIAKLHGDFFEDKIFDADPDSDCSDGSSSTPLLPNGGEEDDSCSSSLDTEDKVCGYRLKEDEEEFENDAIDRYVYDDEEGLPQFFKDDEARYNRRFIYNTDPAHLEKAVSKKEREAKGRKSKRIERKIQKVKDQMERENQDTDLRKIRKSAAKKENRAKPTLVFGRGGKKVPRVKGRVKVVDRRLKKDVSAQKRAAEKSKRSSRKK